MWRDDNMSPAIYSLNRGKSILLIYTIWHVHWDVEDKQICHKFCLVSQVITFCCFRIHHSQVAHRYLVKKGLNPVWQGLPSSSDCGLAGTYLLVECSSMKDCWAPFSVQCRYEVNLYRFKLELELCSCSLVAVYWV